MKFFNFRQNNTGGRFDEDMPLAVIIEARDAEHANERAESLELYFDGCRDGIDCPCCGDRWYRASGHDGEDEPDTTVDEFDQHYVEANRVPCAIRVEYLAGHAIEYAPRTVKP